jgi:L-methionine (R)-S-oxide reductase
MAEELTIAKNISKTEKYKQLLPQLEALLSAETDIIANMANLSAALKETFGFLWVGFYILKEGELVLGPFQGPIACTRIILGNGVCGTSFSKNETLIVDDVNQFPGHIACSSDSKSEIVVPFQFSDINGVLDIDSSEYSSFTEEDKTYLNEIVKLLDK